MSVHDFGAVAKVPINSIHPSPENPRRISDKAVDVVSQSLANFGWQQPIVVDTNNMVIVGHTRLLAAKKLKLTHVPVMVADKLTPQQVKAYRIADNRTGDFSAWDFGELTRQLEELSGDFSDVLALSDWRAVAATFEEMTQTKAPTELGVDKDVANYLSGAYSVTVVCSSEEAARKLAAQVIDFDGVVDVRNKVG